MRERKIGQNPLHLFIGQPNQITHDGALPPRMTQDYGYAAKKLMGPEPNKKKNFYDHHYDNCKSNNHSENIESFGFKSSDK